jgi:hypothetical protein
MSQRSAALCCSIALALASAASPRDASGESLRERAAAAFTRCREHLRNIQSIEFLAVVDVGNDVRKLEYGFDTGKLYATALDLPHGQQGTPSAFYGAFDGTTFQKVNSEGARCTSQNV